MRRGWSRPPAEREGMPGETPALTEDGRRIAPPGPAAGPDPEAVADDLRRRVEGDVLFDPLHRTLYSTAACIYQVMPLGAVVPRHEGDVLAVLEYARRQRIPITARGGGSGLAGQTLGRGIVLDFSRHFQG